MKKYLYFPGCSLKGTGRAYEESLLASFKALGIGLTELPDWNCCGATAYMAVDEMKAFALAARNLALAENAWSGSEPADMIAPCNACYLVLNKTQKSLEEYPETGKRVDRALKAGGLSYRRTVRVRHPLDVLVNDLGLDAIKSQVKAPLKGMKVASYYGCQLVRPYATFDDPHNPTSMDRLMKALGAEPVEWPLKVRCCGGSLTGLVEDIGVRLNYVLLKEARRRGATAVATACPLCQFNLECYQDSMEARYEDPMEVPVAYFTQLLGLALGVPESELGLKRNFVPLRAPALEGGQHVLA